MVVNISFMKGREEQNLLNRVMDRFVRRAGLHQRFAVIQDTYVEGEVDMVFDESLWRRLVDYVAQFDPQAAVTVTEDNKNPYKRRIPLADFLRAWEESERDDPPAFVVARRRETVVLAMVNEYWNLVGGPYPYHDSYTYSLFSNRDLSTEVPQFIAQAAGASRWNLASRMFTPGDTKMPISPVWGWLGTIFAAFAALLLLALFHAVMGK